MMRSRRGWPVLGLVLLAGLLAVLAAATGGPWTISDRGGLWGPATPIQVTMPPVNNPPPMGGQPARSWLAGQPPAWLTWAMVIVLALAIALVSVLIWRRVADWLRRRDAPPIESDEQSMEVRPDAPMIRAGLTSAIDELSVTANPTDAVLRAWIAVESAAGRSGVPRKPSDTPTEFTSRVLAATRADHEAVESLLRLYHQARFSWHGLSAADKARAGECLQGLAASWSAFEAAGAGEPSTGGSTADESGPGRGRRP
jgi:hypothetical protein